LSTVYRLVTSGGFELAARYRKPNKRISSNNYRKSITKLLLLRWTKYDKQPP